MKYKIIIFILTSIVLHANNDDARAARIKELEELQFEYETKIANINYKLLKESNLLASYKSIALKYWEDSEEKFIKCVKKFTRKYFYGKNFESILEKTSLGKKYGKEANILFLRIALQDLYLDKIIIQFNQLTDELYKLNRELKNLKS